MIETVLEVLRASSRAPQMMADVWRRANALRVLRREPYVTSGAKTLPLGIHDGGSSRRP